MIRTVEKLFQEQVTLRWLKEARREFHRYPEISGEEHQTMRRITKYLDAWGVEYRAPVAETGVMAILRGKQPGKTVALRADIDALPIQETNDVGYASKNPGVMHACGHDVHTTVLLGVIKLLHCLEGDFTGTIKCFFQPSEEHRGGAKRMIEEGVLEDPYVDSVIGLHVMPDHSAGSVGVRYGQMYAASDGFEVKVIGKGAHGAMPEEGIDAITVAAHIIVAVQTIVSRNISPLNSVVVSFGKIQGGSVRNQIPGEVTLEGNFRTLDQTTRRDVQERFRTICTRTAESMGAKAAVNILPGYDPLITDTDITDVIYQNAAELLGKDHVHILPLPKMGSEDFSFFAAERPAGFFHLGCAYTDRENDSVKNLV
jgi:amidohydrolase